MFDDQDSAYQCAGCHEYEQERQRLQAEIERLRADSDRLQWLAVHKIQSHSLHMDGNKGFCMRGGWPQLRGRTFREAIDRAMAEAARAAGGE